MPNKKVCKQYPNDQYGPCAPDISGKWEIYCSDIKLEDGVLNTSNEKEEVKIKQFKNLYFSIQEDDPQDQIIGMLYLDGKCWKAKAVEANEDSTMTYQITKIKNGKAIKMISTYTEAGSDASPQKGAGSDASPKKEAVQKGQPPFWSFPRVAIANWYRAD